MINANARLNNIINRYTGIFSGVTNRLCDNRQGNRKLAKRRNKKANIGS